MAEHKFHISQANLDNYRRVFKGEEQKWFDEWVEKHVVIVKPFHRVWWRRLLRRW